MWWWEGPSRGRRQQKCQSELLQRDACVFCFLFLVFCTGTASFAGNCISGGRIHIWTGGATPYFLFKDFFCSSRLTTTLFSPPILLIFSLSHNQTGRYAERNRDAAIVTLDWVRTCGARMKLLPADERFQLAQTVVSALRRRAPRAGVVTDGSGSLPPPAPAAADSRPADTWLPLKGDDAEDLAAAGALGTGVPPPPVLAPVFEGCYFTLAAIKGTSEEAVAAALIRRHGGRLFTSSTAGRARATGGIAFAVCPPGLPPTRAAELRRQDDFREVEEKKRVTLYWLECSVAAGAVQAPNRGAPCYQPLPYGLPLAGMTDIL
jgi:hypothetical protein